MTQQIIFDTSVWIDFLGNKNTSEADLLTNYIENNLPVLLTPTIIQEFSYITTIQLPQIHAAIGAAELYRSMRKKGLTIRKSNDYLIAFYAIEFSVVLAHSDADFNAIADNSTLKIWKS